MSDSYKFSEYIRNRIDCVYLTSEQLKDLTHLTIENNQSKNQNPKYGFWVGNIILPSIGIVIDSGDMVFSFEPTKPNEGADRAWMVSASKGNDTLVGVMELSNQCLRSGVIKSSNPQNEDNKTFALSCVVFAAIQNRLSNPEDNFKIEEKRVQKKNFKKKSKGKGQRKIRLLKSYTLIRTEPIVSHRHGKITCPCWGVRGHYRHYKSGKVVFIAAYQKGKDRSRYTSKEYVVFRKESKNENH